MIASFHVTSCHLGSHILCRGISYAKDSDNCLPKQTANNNVKPTLESDLLDFNVSFM